MYQLYGCMPALQTPLATKRIPFGRAELGGFLCPAGEPSERVLDERIYEQGLPRLDLTIKTLRNEISNTERSGHDTSARRR